MKTRIFLIVAWSMSISLVQTKAGPAKNGKSFNNTGSASCNKIEKDFHKQTPANFKRGHSLSRILKFDLPSKNVAFSNDTATIALFSKYNHQYIVTYPELKDEHIKTIIEYMKFETQHLLPLAKMPPQKTDGIDPKKSTDKWQHTGFIISFIIVLSTLILILLFTLHVKRLEKKMHGKK